jgi:2-oxoglutarate-Fe(II)-dependent oxygenase superfamily protein
MRHGHRQRRVYEDCPAVRFRCPAGDRDDCRHHKTYKSRRLGVTGSVTAALYKLLIYDKGSFFVSHRDTEKVPGMFATLVLTLPSQSEGGELVVRHKDRQVRLELKCDESSEIAFAAFYADCIHEVLPVTAGCRATLVFNLVRQGKGAVPKPPAYEAEAAQVAALLGTWADGGIGAALNNIGPEKIVWPLAHAYTPAELAFNKLKGADAAVAKLLATAAPLADCDLHLALLSVWESGSAEYSGSHRPPLSPILARWASSPANMRPSG